MAKECEHTSTEKRGAEAADCTEPGYTGDTYCTSCGARAATGTAIPALGHDWQTSAGGETCSRCGEFKEIIDDDTTGGDNTTGGDDTPAPTPPGACEHTNTERGGVVSATCSEMGYSGDTYCADCGVLVKNGMPTMNTDHNWKDTNDNRQVCISCGAVQDKPNNGAVGTTIAIGSVLGVAVIAVVLFFIFKRRPI